MTIVRHNISAFMGSDNPGDFFRGAFTVSEGFLGVGILFATIVIAFMTLKYTGASNKDCFAGSVFLGTILSVIMMSFGILLPYYFFALVVLLGLIVFSYAF